MNLINNLYYFSTSKILFSGKTTTIYSIFDVTIVRTNLRNEIIACV